MSAICVFSPGVLVTVTVEDHPTGERLHFHAGGQGTWVARRGDRLGARSSLCTALGGEAVDVARALLARRGDRGAPRATSAAGSLNVTRHGLATGYRPTIDRLSQRVEVSHP